MSDVLTEQPQHTPSAASHKDNLDEFRGGAPKPSARAEADAKHVLAVAQDEMNPWRGPFMDTRDVHLKPLTTYVRDEIALLNRDPARLDEAIKVMTNQPKDAEVKVAVEKDDKGNESLKFDRAGTIHYLPEGMRVDVLNASEEKGIQRIAANMAGIKDMMSWQSMHNLANATLAFGTQDLARGINNLDYELRHNPATKNIQLVTTWNEHNHKDESVAAFGKYSKAYFHTDGRITGDP